jgi:hypothetical protein
MLVFARYLLRAEQGRISKSLPARAALGRSFDTFLRQMQTIS